tara:strand:+ start:383 stop:679 length:297 start_codon:yes stop_codon:yes gene_type:complete
MNLTPEEVDEAQDALAYMIDYYEGRQCVGDKEIAIRLRSAREKLLTPISIEAVTLPRPLFEEIRKALNAVPRTQYYVGTEGTDTNSLAARINRFVREA